MGLSPTHQECAQAPKISPKQDISFCFAVALNLKTCLSKALKVERNANGIGAVKHTPDGLVHTKLLGVFDGVLVHIHHSPPLILDQLNVRSCNTCPPQQFFRLWPR